MSGLELNLSISDNHSPDVRAFYKLACGELAHTPYGEWPEFFPQTLLWAERPHIDVNGMIVATSISPTREAVDVRIRYPVGDFLYFQQSGQRRTWIILGVLSSSWIQEQSSPELIWEGLRHLMMASLDT